MNKYFKTLDQIYDDWWRELETRQNAGEEMSQGEFWCRRTMWTTVAAASFGFITNFMDQNTSYSALMMERTKGVEFGRKVEPMIVSVDAQKEVYRVMAKNAKLFALPAVVWSVSDAAAALWLGKKESDLQTSLVGSLFAGVASAIKGRRPLHGFVAGGSAALLSVVYETTWLPMQRQRMKRIYFKRIVEEEKEFVRVRKNEALKSGEPSTTDTLHL